MFNCKIVLVVTLCISSILGCIVNEPADLLLSADKVKTLQESVENDTLKIQKAPNAPIETLHLKDAVIENEGTEKEKLCLCQSICFRVAQLASQAWEDGVFRTYQVDNIRTGWNTHGPYEFFSNKELNGEIGDLEIPAEKIEIKQLDGCKPTAPPDLTVKDAWFKITFTNGFALFIKVKDGSNGIFPSEFFVLRKQFKNANKNAKDAFKLSYDKCISRIFATPFKGISIEKFIEGVTDKKCNHGTCTCGCS